MKIKKILNNNEGFTIVETMIVLAIAGLILLIVLLAVPALQRQGNNNNTKSDAYAISSAINDFESNNGGYVPQTTNFVHNEATEVIKSASGNSDIKSIAKIQSSVHVTTESTSTTPPSDSNSGPVTIYLDVGYSCSGKQNSDIIAIFYPVEVSSGAEDYSTINCIDA
jgi:prepilin-type N-terminal cleavage/methylation domain-containing protein